TQRELLSLAPEVRAQVAEESEPGELLAQRMADETGDDNEELNRRERCEARLEHISVAYAATALGLTRVPTSDIPLRRRVFLSETQLDQTPQEPHSSVPATSPNVPTPAAAAETLTAAAGLPAAVPET